MGRGGGEGGTRKEAKERRWGRGKDGTRTHKTQGTSAEHTHNTPHSIMHNPLDTHDPLDAHATRRHQTRQDQRAEILKSSNGHGGARRRNKEEGKRKSWEGGAKAGFARTHTRTHTTKQQHTQRHTDTRKHKTNRTQHKTQKGANIEPRKRR